MSARRLTIPALIAFAAATTAARAQTPTPSLETAPATRTEPVPAVEVHRPSPIPDRIIRTIADDPATTIAVTWRTDTTVTSPVGQIALAEHGPKFVAQATTVAAVSQTIETNLNTAANHSVFFEDLQPSTLYVYRVGDGVDWSEWFQVRTASDKPEPFSFLYLGDAQTDVLSLWSRVIRKAFADAPDTAFILHAGDLVNRGWDDSHWGEWFAAGSWINAMIPSAASPGNHEYGRLPGPDGKVDRTLPYQITPHWRAQFALPENGPAGLEETAYYFDYQGVRIVSLNSSQHQPEQAEWLDRILGENPQTWTAITFHHPIYSPAKNRDNAELRGLWQPIFDRHKVDLVLTGHDHTYARTGLKGFEPIPTGATLNDDPNATTGTVYIVSVAGPKMYQLDPEPWMTRSGEDVQLYQIITIEDGVLRYEARTATGETYDGFELHKQTDGRPNRLVDRIPDVPESRRPDPAAAALR